MEDYCDVCANNETEACANCFEANKFLFECPSCAEKDAVIGRLLELAEDLIVYAPEYFVSKHKLDKDLESIKAEARRRAGKE